MKGLVHDMADEKNPIQVADRLFQVVETLAASGSMGLTALSKELSLNKSTTHRILNSLIHMGYVTQDSTSMKYHLTFKIWEIANQLLTKIDMIDIARPFLKQLALQTGETVHLIQAEGAIAIYIDKVESYTNSVRLVSKVGESIPLYCSGVGKAILAKTPDEFIQSVWDKSQVTSLTPNTIISLPAFMKDIESTRQSGYAIDDEENELGVRCIACCLKNYKGNPEYAFSISAPINRMDEKRILELSKYVLATKEKIENQIFSF